MDSDNLNFGPFSRYHLLLKSLKSLQNGDEQAAINLQTEALALGFNQKYCRNSKSNLCDEMIAEMNNKTAIKRTSRPSIQQQCEELPEEWTVVQLCKRVVGVDGGLKTSEIRLMNAGVCATLLRYPRWELNERKPILIDIPAPEGELAEVYPKVVELTDTLKSFLSLYQERSTDDDREYKANYWAKHGEIEAKVVKLVEDLRRWFGAWIFLFQGQFKSLKAKEAEKELFIAVDEVCKDVFGDRQRILLSLAARSVQMMTEDDIHEFCCSLADSQDQFNALYTFLKEEKTLNRLPKEEITNSFPLLLIIDEVLDIFCWEMINPKQEICRLSSLETLHTLYQRYKADISDGYLRLSLTSGSIVLNPERNLTDMETRMSEFFSYWLPDWQLTVGERPTWQQMLDIISQSNAFVYSGHGSGLQFIKPEHFTDLRTRALVFLFGCDSVKLNSDGMWSTMLASHLFYHYALCPTVIGMIYIVTDLQTDVMATVTLSRLINADRTHWMEIEKKNWNRSELFFKGISTNFEPNLMRILCDFRNNTSYFMRQRAAIVCRGLPVWNKC